MIVRARAALRCSIAGALAFAALAAMPVSAQDDTGDDVGLDGLPSATEIARDGEALEALLDDAGYGAAWRVATGLGPVTRSVRVDRSGSARVEELVELTVERDNVTAAHDEVVDDLRSVAVDLAGAVEAERTALIVRNRADVHLQGVKALLRAVALQLFEGAYSAGEEVLVLDNDGHMRVGRDVEITEHTLEELIGRREAGELALAMAEEALAEAIATTNGLAAEHEALDTEAADLERTRRDLDDAARGVLPEAAQDWVLAPVGTEPKLTVRALDAYIRAEQRTTTENPGCAITWRTVAAIAAVEGGHGTYGDRRLTLDGTADRPILGLRLDGAEIDNFGNTVAAIADTDGGRWDGDPVYDRAVGPFQFIPGTWQRWGVDADEDGTADPFDIDDAALAAARYLCSYGSHRSWDIWNASVFGYNHSVDYVASVKAAFDRMQRVAVPTAGSDHRLQPTRPAGTYVPPPSPEEPPEEGDELVDGSEGTAEAGTGTAGPDSEPPGEVTPPPVDDPSPDPDEPGQVVEGGP